MPRHPTAGKKPIVPETTTVEVRIETLNLPEMGNATCRETAMNKRTYSDEEVRDILKRAVEHQDQEEFKYDEQQLFDLGEELGLSQEAIVKAEQEGEQRNRPSWIAALWERMVPPPNPNLSAEEALFQRERLQPLKIQFAVYLVAVLFTFTFNLMTGLAFPWFLFVVFGWAMPLVGFYMEWGRMEGDDYEKSFAKWKQKRKQRLEQTQKP